MTAPKPDPATGSVPAAPSLDADAIRAVEGFAQWCERRADDRRHGPGKRLALRAAADLARLYTRTHS